MIISRAQHITNIINSRLPFAEGIVQVQQNYERLASALEALDKQNNLIAKSVDPEVAGHLHDLSRSLSEIQVEITGLQGELDKLKRRFSRDTLNIGVVGLARQGKSRLLQSLSGLTSTEIPDGRSEYCTGARSIIYHDPDVSPYGEVTFYSEREFLDEIIAPYYNDKHLSFLGNAPLSMAEFASALFPDLPPGLADNAIAKAKYVHLKGYQESLKDYQSLLRTSAPLTIPPEKIREYVAQDTIEGQRTYSNYRAVRVVKIVCRFPQEDVGRIALVDMPGLGDTGIGDQKRLVEILGEDIDFVLFVRMPKALGDAWVDTDINLYELARSALTNLPIRRWSFLILNRVDSASNELKNVENCYRMKDQLLSQAHMTVVDCVIANCANPTEMNAEVLDRVLDYLVGNIRELDRQYASLCQDHVLSLQAKIQLELEKAFRLLSTNNAIPESEFVLFQELFRDVWRTLTNGLNHFLKELSQERDKHSPLFQKSVEEVLDLCERETGVPSAEEIGIRINSESGPMGTYEGALSEIRTLMTRRFASLDGALKASIRGVKEQLVDALLRYGRLEGVTEKRGPDFLHAMTELLEILPPRRRTLEQAFSVLADFDLSYRGFIQYRVRKHLDGLKADKASLPQTINEENLQKILEAKQAETVYQLRQALEESLSDPNEVAFAVVEEFIDQVLRSELAEEDWQVFYQQMRAEIWPKEFKKFAEQSYTRKQWQTAVDHAVQTNQIDLFQFVN